MMNFVNPNLVNVIENREVEFGNYPDDKLTLDEFIKKIENKDPILQGTTVYFNMHDIILDNDTAYFHDEFVHIPTNTKIFVEYDEEDDTWSRTSILIPNHSEKIWIGDDCEDCWWKAQHEVTGFEMKVFVEWT